MDEHSPDVGSYLTCTGSIESTDASQLGTIGVLPHYGFLPRSTLMVYTCALAGLRQSRDFASASTF